MVDHLLAKGFTHLSVLDIASASLEKAKTRLGEKSKLVKFIESDITKFKPTERYQLWHDRAVLHFLTQRDQVEAYLENANLAIAPGGYLIVSTFSKTGPEKCSGLPITQYSDADLKALFSKYFTCIKCLEDSHSTPWQSTQNFIYCVFQKNGCL